MRTRGFTLIEAMIVVAVVVLIAGLVLGMLGLSCGLAGSADHAEQEARAHASKLGWKVSGIACTGRDTDGDGYISCTVALEDGSERALECASGGIGRIEGCKAAALVKQVGRGPLIDGRRLQNPEGL